MYILIHIKAAEGNRTFRYFASSPVGTHA